MKKLSIEEKDLLLRDLCARLPYGVICNDSRHGDSRITEIDLGDETVYCNDFDEYSQIKCIKPYLRPLSSMTEDELNKLKEYSGLVYDQLDLASFQDGAYKCLDFYLNEVPADVVILVFDWLNAHHFDYRGLIERGLALEAPKDVYNIK